MEKSSRTRLLTAAVLVVVFGAGILLGMALSGEAPPETETASTAQRTDPSGRTRRVPVYMQVNPTEAQKATLDSLMKKNHEAMRALTTEFHQEFDPRYDALNKEYRSKYGPRYDSIISGTRAAIRKVLTPEQVVTYDSLIARLDSTRAADRRRGGDRGSRDRD